MSLLLLARIDPILASRIAGHRKGSVTLDTYGHVLLDEPEWRLAELRAGASWVSGLADVVPLGEVDPANLSLSDGMGSTGIEPVTSRV